MTTLTGRALAARLWRDYLSRRWPAMAVAVTAAVVTAGLTGALTWLLGPATDSIFARGPRPHLWLVPAAIVGVAAIRLICQAVQAGLTNRIGHGLVGDIQTQLYGRLLRADLARLRGAHTGGFVSQVLYDAGLIREAATNGVINYAQHGLTVVAMLVVMFYQDWLLTAVVLVAAPALSLITRQFARRARKAAHGAMEETSTLASAMMEGLDGVKIVKIANREAEEEARVAEVIDRRQRHIIKGADARAYASPATEALMMIVTASVIGYVGWRAQTGGMSGGAFTSFIVSLAAASQSLRQLANLQTVMSEGSAAARRLFEALDIEPEVREAPGALALPAGPSTIRFEDVHFAYETGAPALNGVTIEAKRGETVALVGPSGGGKSTTLNLIPRFYDVTEGRVTLDGHDVRDVTLASLRERIALVTQEPFLFDDTIAANIAYGREGATADDIAEAARQAAAHEFILGLPKGYDTPVGEAGARLSGGQRQRIAIARAFLKNAPILLLDEATSALDTESEAQVQVALERLMAGRTTVLIAHRLSTVRAADRIYVIDRGRVVETGGHNALVAAGGLYARLARSQDLDRVEEPGTPA
ncbi:MAG: ABC transporter ATP-binding protein [Caulobacterales bacterium]|nr:ABC transporter ATP-binding protein [Caulobacterales bacterium]